MTTYSQLSQTQLAFTQVGVEASKFVQSDIPLLELSQNNGTNLANLKGTSLNVITLSGSGDLGNVLLTGLNTPLSSNDAVNKSYVDSLVISGITWKNAARVATISNIPDLSSVTDIDGITLADEDRVVVKDQNTTTENGIYVYNLGTTTLSRSSDAAAGTKANGSAIFVYAGTTNNDRAFVITNDTNVNWDSGVTFGLMSSVPATQVAGSDTQIQYNDSDILGAASSFTFNKSTSNPVLNIGTNGASTLATVNVGAGTLTNTSVVFNIGDGIGTTTIDSQGSGIFTMQTANSTVNLFNTNTSSSINFATGLTTGGINIGNSSTTGTVDINTTGQLNIGINSSDIAIGGSDAGNVQIGTGTATSVDTDGGDFSVTCGNGNGTGTGGVLNILAGRGGSTGVGGNINIIGGDGGPTSGNGGSVTIQAGSSTSGDDGNVILKLASANTGITDNIIQFQSSNGTELGRFDSAGKMYATIFQATSDAKYKKNIQQLTNSLDVVNKINGYSYEWNNNFPGNDNNIHYGVIAQQLEEIGLGNLVSEGNTKTVNYIGLIPLLIEAIKELTKKIN